MLELTLCSMLTILPDFLFRRFAQGKRIGREITLFSVWFELRWGITLCVILTLSLITTIFYFHPATSSAVSFFRAVSILPEGSGRVAEVFVDTRQEVKAGQPIFRLESSEQEVAVEAADRGVTEVEAALLVARTDLAAADARIAEARSAYLQAKDELDVRTELRRRNPDTVALREIERLQNVVDGRQAGIDVAIAGKSSTEAQVNSLLPAQLASAESALAQAQVDLDKRTVYAGVDGWIEQFSLRPGDFINQMMRPAGILIPANAGRVALQAGFGQIEAQVLRPGMLGEVACIALPFQIVPVVVTQVQGVIASGQIRPTDQLVETTQVTAPGRILAYLEPLFPGQLDALPPGSSCVANAYTSHHEALQDPALSEFHRIVLHVIDATGMVHAMLLRIQALLMPVQTLVLGGGH